MKKFLMFICIVFAGCVHTMDFVLDKDVFKDEAKETQYYIDTNGKPVTGNVMRYYDSGKLRSTTPIVNGFVEGKIRRYYENSGKLELVSPYKNGQQHGIQKGYNESGALFLEHTWKNGKLEGIVKYYDENERVLSEYLYKDGKIESVSRFRDGKRRAEEIGDNSIREIYGKETD